MRETIPAQAQQALRRLEQYRGAITHDTLAQILPIIVETVGADAGTLWFYHRFEDGLIRPWAVYGGDTLTNIYLLPGEGIAGQVIDKGEAMLISDCKTDPRWTKKVDVETGFVTKTTVCVPLRTTRMTYGSIQLVNRAGDARFTEVEFALLETLAARLSALLEGNELLGEYNTEPCENITLAKENDAQRLVIKRLSTYMDPTIIHEILREDGKHKKSIDPKEAAVLFADIRGFTGLARHISGTQLISALSDFLSITSHSIHAYGGVIDKFMGDCTMAYWKTEDNPHAALAACRCACQIQKEAAEFTARVLRQTGIEIGIGIGVHVGPVLFCHVGDEQYMAYTVIGSTVNTACRIEEHTPAGQIYISQEVADCLGGAASTEPLPHKLHWRGKDAKMKILSLTSLDGE